MPSVFTLSGPDVRNIRVKIDGHPTELQYARWSDRGHEYITTDQRSQHAFNARLEQLPKGGRIRVNGRTYELEGTMRNWYDKKPKTKHKPKLQRGLAGAPPQAHLSPTARRAADRLLPIELSAATEGGFEALRLGDCAFAFGGVIASTAISAKLARLTGHSSDRAAHLRKKFLAQCVRPQGTLEGARRR